MLIANPMATKPGGSSDGLKVLYSDAITIQVNEKIFNLERSAAVVLIASEDMSVFGVLFEGMDSIAFQNYWGDITVWATFKNPERTQIGIKADYDIGLVNVLVLG